MDLAGPSIKAAVSPVFLKTYTLCSYIGTLFFQFNSMIIEVLDVCER
jgi:hypothetical protein